MSIADLFESGERKEQKGTFRNLVMIALSDGKVTEEEELLLKKLTKKLDLPEEIVADIRKNPTDYPMYPPYEKEERCSRMISLVTLAMSDGELDAREMATLNKVAIGLGYTESKAAEVTNKILHGLRIGMDKSEILDQLMASR
jgi:uncharacterized membrane protein YebE (DUF533 family)